MKRALWAVWLIAPVAAAAYHYGPGQERLTLDRAAACISEAESHARAAQAAASRDGEGAPASRDAWKQAVERYEEALRLLPAERAAESRRVRLEIAKARMHVSQLPVAHGELETLLDELAADPAAGDDLLADARAAYANSQYYMTWLLRLEGAGRDQWEPKIDGARQNYRWLAESAAARDDAAALAEHRRNLEAAIRLARMDLEELQGLPLPSQ